MRRRVTPRTPRSVRTARAITTGGGIFGLTIGEAKSRFFREEPITGPMEKAAWRVARRAGGAIRKTARRSMRRARRYTSESQLPAPVLADYKRRRRAWHLRNRLGYEPGLPFRASKPGRPPRARTGYLRKFLYFAQEKRLGSPGVIVGPVRLQGRGGNVGDVPRLHEHGGTGSGSGGIVARFPPRPYMKPALNKIKPQLRAYWRDALAKAA